VLNEYVGLVTFDAVLHTSYQPYRCLHSLGILNLFGRTRPRICIKAHTIGLQIFEGALRLERSSPAGYLERCQGQGLAAASVMSEIAIPNMRRLGYSEVLPAGWEVLGPHGYSIRQVLICHLWDYDRYVGW